MIDATRPAVGCLSVNRGVLEHQVAEREATGARFWPKHQPFLERSADRAIEDAHENQKTGIGQPSPGVPCKLGQERPHGLDVPDVENVGRDPREDRNVPQPEDRQLRHVPRFQTDLHDARSRLDRGRRTMPRCPLAIWARA